MFKSAGVIKAEGLGCVSTDTLHTRMASTKCTPDFVCWPFTDNTLTCCIINGNTSKCVRYIDLDQCKKYIHSDVFHVLNVQANISLPGLKCFQMARAIFCKWRLPGRIDMTALNFKAYHIYVEIQQPTIAAFIFRDIC